MSVDLNDLFRGDAVRLVRRKNGATFGRRTRIGHVYSIVPPYEWSRETVIYIRLRNGEIRDVCPDQIVKIRDGDGLLPHERGAFAWIERGCDGEVTQA